MTRVEAFDQFCEFVEKFSCTGEDQLSWRDTHEALKKFARDCGVKITKCPGFPCPSDGDLDAEERKPLR